MLRTNYVQLMAEDTNYLALALTPSNEFGRRNPGIKALQESARWDKLCA
jgi:hypothetical protein